MEPVPADLVPPDEPSRKRVGGGCGEQGPMECGVEYSEIRSPGERCARGADAREIDRVVQRRQSSQFLDLLLHLVGDKRRRVELAASGFVNVLWPRGDGLIWPIQDGVF